MSLSRVIYSLVEISSKWFILYSRYICYDVRVSFFVSTQSKGELSAERTEENEKAQKAYDKLLTNTSTLAVSGARYMTMSQLTDAVWVLYWDLLGRERRSVELCCSKDCFCLVLQCLVSLSGSGIL